jgi:hypothetical protein
MHGEFRQLNEIFAYITSVAAGEQLVGEKYVGPHFAKQRREDANARMDGGNRRRGRDWRDLVGRDVQPIGRAARSGRASPFV